jgi:hypothetical protein
LLDQFFRLSSSTGMRLYVMSVVPNRLSCGQQKAVSGAQIKAMLRYRELLFEMAGCNLPSGQSPSQHAKADAGDQLTFSTFQLILYGRCRALSEIFRDR